MESRKKDYVHEKLKGILKECLSICIYINRLNPYYWFKKASSTEENIVNIGVLE